MKRCALAAVLLSGTVLLCSGCGKKEAEAPSAPTTSSSQQDGVAAVTTAPRSSVKASEPVSPAEVGRTAVNARTDPEVARLIEQLSGDDPKTCAEAAYELGRMGSRAAPATEALAGRLRDNTWVTVPSTGNRESQAELAGKTLAAIGPDAIPILVEKLSEGGVCSIAARSLGTIGAPAVDPVLEALDSRDSFTRTQARTALEAIGEPSIEPLIAALQNGKAYQRREGAAQVLGEMAVGKAVGPLVAALEDESRPVRNAAARSLGQIRDPAALAPLCKLLAEGPDKYGRVVAAGALGALANGQAVQPLIAALEARDEDVREAAVKALGELKASEALDPILKLIHETDSDIREAVYVALGAIGDQRSVEPLVAALKKETRERLRGEIAVSLGHLGDREAIPALLAELEVAEDYTLLRKVAEALTEIPDPQAVPALVSTLRKGREHGVNSRVCEALAEIGAPAVAPLMGLIQDGTYDGMASADRSALIKAVSSVTRVRQPRDSTEVLEWWEKNKERYPAP